MEYSTHSLKTIYGKMKSFGREKFQEMREKRIEECEKRIKQLEHTFSSSTIQATFGGHEKERDWAIWGGMASGAGGIGAGVSTAIDVQRTNAEIRQRNAQRDEQARQISAHAQNAMGWMTERYVNEIAVLQEKAVREQQYRYCIGIPTDTLFGMLEIKIDEFNQNSAYGWSSMGMDQTVSPTITMTSQYQGGYIDGYVKVTVEQEGSFVMPLPYGGVGPDKIFITIDTKKTDGWQYNRVTKVEPLVLWTVEERVSNNNYCAYRVEELSGSPDYSRFLNEWRNVSGNIFTIPKEKQARRKLTKDDWQAVAYVFVFSFLIVFFIAFIIILINNESESAQFVMGRSALWALCISGLLSFVIAVRD